MAPRNCSMAMHRLPQDVLRLRTLAEIASTIFIRN